MAKRPTSDAWVLLAYEDNPVARTYRLSEAGRRERVERMKRLNADPIFAARRDVASGERKKRLHADPVFLQQSKQQQPARP